MSEPRTARAHAKVNLALRVLARDATGYHQLETVFQRIALADEVTVRPTSGSRSLDVIWEGTTPSDLGPVTENLAWRAAAAFAGAAGWPGGWEIAITKRIPAGSGLGGGSADAAAVLRALNAGSPQPLPAEQLLMVAARLGADVPFLTQDVPLALGTGRGDVLTPLPPLPRAPLLAVLPDFGMNTASAYAALAAARATSSGPAPAASFDPAGWRSWLLAAERQANDFEPTVFAAHPALAAVRDRLASAGALIARLSGSGSALFGIWPAGTVPPPVELPPGWTGVTTTTV